MIDLESIVERRAGASPVIRIFGINTEIKLAWWNLVDTGSLSLPGVCRAGASPVASILK